ncbi:hypothetical protein EDB87DRAFT_1573180 [Lactarius vividus]|nr:hypothetical protein EDB87DRAFT_1573180 [Lactarius vividus]
MEIGWSPVSASGNSVVLVVVLWVSVGVQDRARLRQEESAANTTVEQMAIAAIAWVEMRELCLRCMMRVAAWPVEASRCGGSAEWSRSINCGVKTLSGRAVVILRTARSVMYCSESRHMAHNTRGDNASVERRTI